MIFIVERCKLMRQSSGTMSNWTLSVNGSELKDNLANASVENSTERNATNVPANHQMFWAEEQRVMVIFLFLFIMVGNSIVLVAVAVSKRKSRMNFFIKQLAFADLLVGVFSVLPDLVLRFTMHWYAGEVMCKIVRFGMAAVTYGSTFVLVALSIDRLDAIARPLGFSDSSTREIIGLKGCARECYKRRGQCVAVNYQKEHLICHILDVTSANAPDKLENKNGSTYSEIDTWNGDFDSKSCGSVSCGTYKTCVELKSGKTTCQLDHPSCSKGKFFNGSGCVLCPANEFKPISGHSNCSVCLSGEGKDWIKPRLDRISCRGCWYEMPKSSVGYDTYRISIHTVADRNECYLLCVAHPNCLAVQSTEGNTECSLFSTRSWFYGMPMDSVFILVDYHCRP